MSLDRAEALAKLLQETGFADAARTPFPGDASTRSYARLFANGRRAILMDAPPSNESPPCPPGADPETRRRLGWNALARLAASRVEAFVAVAQHLQRLGLSAPDILGADIRAGYAIVEDLGDDLFARVVEEGADEVELYVAAAEVLAVAHAAPIPETLPTPVGNWPLLDYDDVALRANADLFFEWIPYGKPDAAKLPGAQARWERIRDALVEEAMGFTRALTIRDYHAENLLWLPQREGVRKVGLLDFQDALRGWPAWDFVMLLQDARRDVAPAAAEAAIAHYLRRTGMPEAAFQKQFAVLGALNALRILGLFVRLVERDGKARYRQFQPREWGHLARNLAHPELAELAAFVSDFAGPQWEHAG